MEAIQHEYPAMLDTLYVIWKENEADEGREYIGSSISEHKANRRARRVGGYVEKREV